jgi:hypothetical protein
MTQKPFNQVTEEEIKTLFESKTATLDGKELEWNKTWIRLGFGCHETTTEEKKAMKSVYSDTSITTNTQKFPETKVIGDQLKALVVLAKMRKVTLSPACLMRGKFPDASGIVKAKQKAEAQRLAQIKAMEKKERAERRELGKKLRTQTWYKCVGKDLRSIHGGTFQFVVGEWTKPTHTERCASGYHVADAEHIREWARISSDSVDCRIYKVEVKGECDHGHDKTAWQSIRLVSLVDGDELQTLLNPKPVVYKYV